MDDECFRDKYLVLSFFPADFTDLDITELVAYSGRVKDFLEADCEIG